MNVQSVYPRRVRPGDYVARGGRIVRILSRVLTDRGFKFRAVDAVNDVESAFWVSDDARLVTVVERSQE